MNSLEELKAEYIQQLGPIRKRREDLQASLSAFRGQEYIRARKRIDALFLSELNLIDGIQEIQRSIDGKTRF